MNVDLTAQKVDEAFSKQSTEDFLLISKGDVGFFFPRSILINQSTFFRDLESIGNAAEESPIPVQSVELSRFSPRALRWSLRILSYILCGGHLPPFDGDELADVLLFADMCDLPIIPRMLYHLYAPELEDSFWILALAHFADRKDDMLRLRTKTLEKNISHISVKAKAVLRDFAPDELLLLYELHQQRTSDFITLNSWLTDVTDRGAYFSDDCAKARCPTYLKYGGDWWAARVHVGSLVWQAMQYKSRAAVQDTAEDLLFRYFGCGSCRSRIMTVWEPALASYAQHAEAD